MYNQSQIKNLIFPTIADAKAAPAVDQMCFIVEKDSIYTSQYIADGTTNGVADDDKIIVSSVDDYFWKKFESGGGGTVPELGETGMPTTGATSALQPSVTIDSIAGGSIWDAFKAIHFPASVPVQVLPTIDHDIPASSLVPFERYTNVTIPAYNVVFTQNSGGAATNYKETITVTSGASANNADGAFSGTTVTSDASSTDITIAWEVAYDAGDIPNDSYGNPVPADQVQAGTATKTIVIKAFDYSYHGALVKGDIDTFVSTLTEAERKTKLATLTKQTERFVTKADFTIAKTDDYVIAVPAGPSQISLISSGFPLSIGEYLGTVDVHSANDSDTVEYAIFVIRGQASETQIDSVTIS
jgi:hypothetical protein